MPAFAAGSDDVIRRSGCAQGPRVNATGGVVVPGAHIPEGRAERNGRPAQRTGQGAAVQSALNAFHTAFATSMAPWSV